MTTAHLQSINIILLLYQIYGQSVQWEPNCSMRMDRRTDGQTDRQTDRQDEANIRFSQFYERP